jgi:hypothetical protein
VWIDLVLGLVLFGVAAAFVTVLMHAFLRVPYVPTSRWIAKEMIKAAKLKGHEHVYDLGAGDGRLLMMAKRRYPGIRAVGCEIVPTVWCMGIINRFFLRSKVELYLRSALEQDIRDADVLLLYLTPTFLAKLTPKFTQELKKGTRIVSHAFKIPGLEPKEQIRIKSRFRRALLNVYEWQG